jgi:tetratricopeptide (TPR) repeat protein
MIYINVVAIYTEELAFRKKYLLNALKIIEDLTTKKGYVYKIHIIKEAFDVDVDPENPKLEKTHQSNFSKQKQAIQRIVDLEKIHQVGDMHYYMCIEDDCVFLPQFLANFERFLENISVEKWDILFLCICQPEEQEEFGYCDTRGVFNVLQSKECYMITCDAAKKLLPALEKMTLSYRQQLSEWIQKNPEIISKYPTKRISVEGSKVGIMPSSVNNNNVLIYNSDYLKLFNMVLGKEPLDIDVATKIYNVSSHLNSPDIIHLYAVILFKIEKLAEAKEYFLEAINQSILKNGKLDKNTELLNNAINICGLYQPDRDLYRKTPSKYAV